MADFFQRVADFFSPSFDANVTKVACRTAISRLSLQKNKMQNKLTGDAKIIAGLVMQEKEELARIRVEAFMNDEKFVHVCELVALMCEKVSIRLDLLAMQPTLPEELKEAIFTIVYAAPRVEVQELRTIAHQMGLKYGREWLEEAQFGGHYVNQVVRQKLEVTAPDPSLVGKYLETIVDHAQGVERKKAEANARRSDGGGPSDHHHHHPGGPGGGPGNAPEFDFPTPPDSLGRGGGDGGDIGFPPPPAGPPGGGSGGFGGGGGNFSVPTTALGGNGSVGSVGGGATTPQSPAPSDGPSYGLGGIGGPGYPSLPPAAPSSNPSAGDTDMDMASLMARFDALRNKTDSL